MTTKQKPQTFLPGPWTVQPIGDETECNILGPARELIATVSDNEARLIAAAPELLEAAKTALAVLEYEPEPKSTKTLAILRAAIAKATGQEPR